MSFAVIENKGKQYMVIAGQAVKMDYMEDLKEGDVVLFDKVLALNDGKEDRFGAPYLAGAKVSAVCLKQGRGPKLEVVRYKSKARQYKRNTHRQPFTEVRIEKII